MGDLVKIGNVFWSDTPELENKRLTSELFFQKEENKKLKSLLDKAISKIQSLESKEKSKIINLIPKKEIFINEYLRKYNEISPNLFENIIKENKKDYMTKIEDELFYHLDNNLEKEINRFIFKRTLSFNKTREKISQSEFINGKINNEGSIITKPIKYSKKSVERGIKLSKSREIFFTYQFKKGDSCWYFLNTRENIEILEKIKQGLLKETDLYKLNNIKVKELKNRVKLDTFDVGVSSKCLNSTDIKATENTKNKEFENHYITTKRKNHKQQIETYSKKEKEYILKLTSLKLNGISLNFGINQAKKIVKLGMISSKSIFQIIDDQIEYLPFRNLKSYSPESILYNSILEDRKPDINYQNYIEFNEKDKYDKVLKLWYPETHFTRSGKSFTIQMIKQYLLQFKEVYKAEKSPLMKNNFIYLIQETKKICNFEKDLDISIKEILEIIRS